MLDESDIREAERRQGLIRDLFKLFAENVEGLANKVIPRTNFSNLKFHVTENIIERNVFIFTDASERKMKD